MTLHQISIKARIIIIALLPTLCVVWLSLDRLIQAANTEQHLEKLTALNHFSNSISLTIFELQNERDISAAFVESQGKEFTSELRAQRKRTDEKIGVLFSLLPQIQTSIDKQPELSEAITNFSENLGLTLQETREKIDSLELNFEGSLVAYRPKILVHMITSINLIAQLSKDHQLSLHGDAYFFLIEAQERLSIERATLNAVLAKQEFAAGRYRRFSIVQETGNNYIGQFSNAADSDIKSAYQEKVSEVAAIKSFDQFRKSINLSFGKTFPDISLTQWHKLSSQRLTLMKEVENILYQKILLRLGELSQKAKEQSTQALVLLIGLISGLSLLSFVFIKSIIDPLKKQLALFEDIAENHDITQRLAIEGNDELASVAKAFNHLAGSVHETLQGIQLEADKLADTTHGVANSMTQSLRGTENQRNNTAQVFESVEKVNQSSIQVNEYSNQTVEAVDRAQLSSNHSSEKVNSTRIIIDTLFTELENTDSTIRKLNDESIAIGNILEVIKGVADQTNLLALNASIEAARAGEQGRGFAVVADEVRNLAKTTLESAGQIQEQIESLQHDADTALENMQALNEKGARVNSAVQESVEASQVLREELSRIIDITQAISSAVLNQHEVTQSMTEQLNGIKSESQVLAAQAQSTSDSSQGLMRTADKLKEFVAIFKV